MVGQCGSLADHVLIEKLGARLTTSTYLIVFGTAWSVAFVTDIEIVGAWTFCFCESTTKLRYS